MGKKRQRLEAQQSAEPAAAPEEHPVARNLRHTAAAIESGGVDTWLILTIQPDGKISFESHFGQNQIHALGIVTALQSDMARGAADRVFRGK